MKASNLSWEHVVRHRHTPKGRHVRNAVAILAHPCVLAATLIGCAPRHPLDGQWHTIKWHRERPNVIYGAAKEHEVLIVRPEIDQSYIDFCLTDFAKNLKRYAPEHAKFVSKWEQDLSPEITRAVQQTGGAFLVLGNHNIDYLQMDFSNYKNDHYDFVCSSPFRTIYCRISDKTCGDSQGLHDKPRAERKG